MKYLTLRSGGNMPIVGYGTWLASDNALEEALNEALKCGYRHIDTAAFYANELVIGKVLNEWITAGKVTREDLFIVTKLPITKHRPEDVESSLKKSLEYLLLDYVDLYLVHTPFGTIDQGDFMDITTVKMDYNTDHLATWKVMEEQVHCGRTKAIGLSNFNIKQVQKVLDNCLIKPDVLQVELHLYLQQPVLVEYCKENGIVVTAYSSLGTKGSRDMFGINWTHELPEMMEHEVVTSIANKYNKTPAQVLLRFFVQRDIVVIPKSLNPQRLSSNIKIFDFKIDDGDLELLKNQDVGEGGRIIRFHLLPGIYDHPEYPFPKDA